MEDIIEQLRVQLAATQQELEEVTRERDDYKQAVDDLGLTPEEARAGAKRSRDMKQQLLATQAKLLESEQHAARLREDAERYREICRMFMLANEKALSILPPYRPEDYARKEQK